MQGLFYSNPDIKYKDSKTGSYLCNNALWIISNRFALERVGDESQACPKSGFFDPVFIEAFLAAKNGTELYVDYIWNHPFIPTWSGT